jgi:hypothetical protein
VMKTADVKHPELNSLVRRDTVRHAFYLFEWN